MSDGNRVTPQRSAPPPSSSAAPGVGSGPPAWDWEARFGADRVSVFDSGLAFEDALIIFITLMAREEEELALEASRALADDVTANVSADGAGAPGDHELIARRVQTHLERKGQLLLLVDSIADSFNRTLDGIIQSIGQP